MREEPSSTAEVDYVVQCGNAIVPVEVKSGASGRMKGRECRYALLSLPLYMVGQLDRLVRHALSRRDLRVKP